MLFARKDVTNAKMTRFYFEFFTFVPASETDGLKLIRHILTFSYISKPSTN